jgi:hypothetical protein
MPRNDQYAALWNAMLAFPDDGTQVLRNLGLWHPGIYDARFLAFADLYRNHLLDAHGSILEFGVRWGQDLAWLVKLRELLEPRNEVRAIYGFDTFTGHQGSSAEDGGDWMASDGAFDTVEGWAGFLRDIITIHASYNPESAPVVIVAGDVRETLPSLLADQMRQLVVGMAIFDLDLYGPTLEALEALVPRFHDGTVVVFDELDAPRMPGETLAVLEAIGLDGRRLRRFPYDSMSYLIWGER